jgi:hypothetical protein
MDPHRLSLALSCNAVNASFRGISDEEFPLVPESEDGTGMAAKRVICGMGWNM